jgi:hypothetical protein
MQFALAVFSTVAQPCKIMSIEAVAAATTAVVAKKAVGTAAISFAKKFGGSVIARWTNYRAERFYKGFIESFGNELSTGIESPEVNTRLDKILADDTKSEILFDAYRRVCFSTSKDIGPRIIGLLTGQLVREGRMADKMEENVFEAAELLSDGDLLEFMKSYQGHRRRAEGITNPESECYMLEGSVVVQWREVSSSSSAPSSSMDIGPFPWRTDIGRWAGKLNSIGLIETKVEQVSGLAYNNLGITIKTRVVYHSSCTKLSDLLSRSFGPSVTSE